MMSLRGKLASPKGSKTVSEYFQSLRSISDDLPLINCPVTEEELVIHVLNEIGSDFHKIVAEIKARETKISFEELLNKILNFEDFLRKQEEATYGMMPSANYAARNNFKTQGYSN